MKYRPYEQNQVQLFGIDVDERVPKNHLVRFVSDTIDSLDLQVLHNSYSEEGCPGYNPKMMLKIVVYAYMSGIYTCRKIARAARENINFIWLSGDTAPNFRTINTFCWTRCKDQLVDIFTQVVIKAHELGYLEFDNCFVDGTTFRGSAGKHSHVWKKNAIRYKEQAKKRVEDMFIEIEALNTEEDKLYGTRDLNEMGESSSSINIKDSDQIKARLDHEETRLNKAVELLKQSSGSDKKTLKMLKSAISKLQKTRKAELPKLQKYENQLDVIGEDRSSCSKTDPDATFIRLKDGSLAPGYISSISTTEQFVTGVHVYNLNRETKEFPVLIEQLHDHYGSYPKTVIGDAAYGTGNNLHFVEQKGIKSYLKPQDYRIDYRESALSDLSYDESNDVWTCPMEKTFVFVKEDEVSENGPKRMIRKYTCFDCSGCPLATKCIRTKDKTKRHIYYDPYLTPLKQKTVANLKSEEGIKLTKKRGIEPEAVFSFVKWNRHFSRLTVRGLAKCRAQLMLVFLGHNLGKMFLRGIQAAPIS